jgi:hypothetical protein
MDVELMTQMRRTRRHRHTAWTVRIPAPTATPRPEPTHDDAVALVRRELGGRVVA